MEQTYALRSRDQTLIQHISLYILFAWQPVFYSNNSDGVELHGVMGFSTRWSCIVKLHGHTLQTTAIKMK